MSEKFRGKYRSDTTRLQKWDYGWNAPYMVTITTQFRNRDFGCIENGRMTLSPTGLIAQDMLVQIPLQFPYCLLGEWVIMPDHLHMIIFIKKTGPPAPIDVDLSKGGITGRKNPMLHDNLSRIVRWFKGRTTYEVRKSDKGFAWQPRFYDQIIRDQKSLENMTAYIRSNPAKWDKK